MNRAVRLLRLTLEGVTTGLVVALAVVVVAAVVARYAFNSSFVWYDEVASVLLAWITFYGAALAMLRRRHIGFPGLVIALPKPLAVSAFVSAEMVVFCVFAAFAYAGWLVLGVLGNETLVSLDVPLWVTQSAVPIGAVLFLTAQIFSMRQAWQDMLAGRSAEDEEIEEEIARSQAALARQKAEKRKSDGGEKAS